MCSADTSALSRKGNTIKPKNSVNTPSRSKRKEDLRLMSLDALVGMYEANVASTSLDGQPQTGVEYSDNKILLFVNVNVNVAYRDSVDT